MKKIIKYVDNKLVKKYMENLRRGKKAKGRNE